MSLSSNRRKEIPTSLFIGRRSRFGFVLSACCFLIVALLACMIAPANGKEKNPSKSNSKSSKALVPDFSDTVFGTNAPIRTFHIEVTTNEMAALQKDVRGYVRGTITEGSNVFHNVGVHLKGNGSFQPLDKKPSFVAKFDRYVPGQKYFSLSKIALNNASQDPTFLAEYMATWMFRDANVPSPRVVHARLTFNGRDLGLYVCIEAENKEFLKRWFHNHDGNLYENYVKDIDSPMDQDNGNENSQGDVKRLLAVARLADPAERWTKLNTVLDVDRYVSHLACEMFTSHRDGYALNRNNYRIYDDPATGRFTFIGHGLDWGFSDAGISIQPPQNSIITRAVLTTPQGNSSYRERARLLFTNVFQLDVLTNRVNCAVARLVSQARDTNEAKQFLNFGHEMRNRLVARRQNLANQFAAEPQPPAFDAKGIAKLNGWKKKTESGRPIQDEVRLDSRNVLRISSTNSACVASWRVRVRLAPGKYDFEGDARTSGVAALTNDSGSGAALYISSQNRDNKVVGDTAWTHLSHEVLIDGGERDVELVCELRANKGAVWFDADSLRLKAKSQSK